MNHLTQPEEQYVQGFHAVALSLLRGVPLAARRQFDSAPERICINSTSIHQNIIYERLYLQNFNQINLTRTGDSACKQDRSFHKKTSR